MTVAILGAGRVGGAMARLFAAAGPLQVWGSGLDAAAAARNFPGCTRCDSVAMACAGASIVVVTVSVRKLRQVAEEMGATARGDQVVLLTARGVEAGFVLPHEILRQETCIRKIGALGGPVHAAEVAMGQPSALVVASRFAEVSNVVQRSVGGAAVVYPTRDLVGVEVASAIANVAAIAVGMAAALGLSDTVRGVLVTRGLGEAARLGRALGAELATFSGLAGVGALMPRPLAPTEHHMELGRLLARGSSLAAAQAQVGRAVDGVLTATQAVLLARARGLEVPLMQAVEAVTQGAAAGPALSAVLHLGLDFGGSLGGG